MLLCFWISVKSFKSLQQNFGNLLNFSLVKHFQKIWFQLHFFVFLFFGCEFIALQEDLDGVDAVRDEIFPSDFAIWILVSEGKERAQVTFA